MEKRITLFKQGRQLRQLSQIEPFIYKFFSFPDASIEGFSDERDSKFINRMDDKTSFNIKDYDFNLDDLIQGVRKHYNLKKSDVIRVTVEIKEL